MAARGTNLVARDDEVDFWVWIDPANQLVRQEIKRVRSCGHYTYSTHDSAWVDLLRENLGTDQDGIRRAAQSYWQGKRWAQEPVIMEVLFMGRIDFYDRSLDRGP